MKIFAAIAVATATLGSPAFAGDLGLSSVQHGSAQFRQLYTMGPVYRFEAGDTGCHRMPSIPTYHANFTDSEFTTTRTGKSLIIAQPSYASDEPLFFAYSSTLRECQAIMAEYQRAEVAQAYH